MSVHDGSYGWCSSPTVLRASLAAAISVVSLMYLAPAFAKCSDAPGPGVDWSGCSKQLLMLEGTDMSHANFLRTFLSGTVLNSVNLQGANFTSSELPRTSFKGADLSGASFEKALASRADFGNANLTRANLVK